MTTPRVSIAGDSMIGDSCIHGIGYSWEWQKKPDGGEQWSGSGCMPCAQESARLCGYPTVTERLRGEPMIVGMGINDGAVVSPSQVEHDLREIATSLRDRGFQVVGGSPAGFGFDWRHPLFSWRSRAQRRAYAQAVERAHGIQ